MRAVIVDKPRTAARLTTLPDPVPAPDDAVIAVRGCGICGTDRHIVEDGLTSACYPLVPGHEAWGEVVAVGSRNAAISIGDLVAIDPSLHCGVCDQCRHGRHNLCRDWGAIGGTRHGAWADFVAAPTANLHALDENFPLDCAVLIEPVACALRGIERLKPHPGRTALIYGGGTMGLLLAILLTARDVGPVVVVEPQVRKRRLIAQLLPELTVCTPDELGNFEADHVLEASGSGAALVSAFDHVGPGGTVVVFGVAAEELRIPISPFEIYRRELTIVGSMSILGTFAEAIAMVRRHAARLRQLVSQRFELADFSQALGALKVETSVKIAIEPRHDGI